MGARLHPCVVASPSRAAGPESLEVADRRDRHGAAGVVGFDIAFLAMDLWRRDERLAAALMAAYRGAGGDPGDDALVAFFAAQRAV